MQDDNKYYVYTMLDPRSNMVFYIGKGQGDRYLSHETEARSKYWYNKAKCQTICNIWEAEFEVKYEFHSHLTESEAFELEKQLIEQHGRLCNNTGTLTNIHPGGGGRGRSGMRVYQYTLTGNLVTVYESVSIASAKTGIKESTISATCRGETQSSGGFQWSYEAAILNPYRRTSDKRKSVHQFTLNGELINTYECAKDACEALGYPTNGATKISAVCNNTLPSYKGYGWSYNTTFVPVTAQSKIVEQYDLMTGETIATYKSIAEAVRLTNIRSISAACNNKMKQAGGFGWKFVNAPSTRKRTFQQYKQSALDVHGSKYDYAKWTEFKGYHVKFVIVCHIHGEFEQTYANHVKNKAGCPGCRKDQRAQGFNKRSREEWLSACRAVHGDAYEYKFPDTFSNADIDNVQITCQIHGEFQQKLSDHVRKKAGCPSCAVDKRRGRKATHIPMEVYDMLDSEAFLHMEHNNKQKPMQQIGRELNVSEHLVAKYMTKHNVLKQRFAKSTAESDLYEAISTICPPSQIKQNTKQIISPQELDLYLVDHKLAIEYCGLYWHSDKFKTSNYHVAKLKACNEQSIRLITLYDDEWQHKRNIVLSKISNIINQAPSAKIFARKCTISVVNTTDKRTFFDDNHIQGDGPSSINYGLYYDNELVACIAFIAKKDGVFILNRFATSTAVTGGFTKLLKHFQRNHKWAKIETFADLRWSEGDLYHKTGFVEEYTIPPDYYWTDGRQRFHKFGFRHKHLPKKLKVYDPELSEVENCHNNGLYRIYDCGKIKFSLTNDS